MSDERSSDIKSSYANKVDKRKYKKREKVLKEYSK